MRPAARVLSSAPKIFGAGVHRVVAPHETLRHIGPAARRAGVTRLCDITGLDRIGIPTYSAVVPKSRDILSVYNGKGATKTDAACGALMEAIERQSALQLKRTTVAGSYADVSRSGPALHPGSLVQKLHPEYSDDLPLQWLEGWDLASECAILVPARAAAFNLGRDYGPPCLDTETSNGLASGNVIEEAICHALCELIERDAWTIAELLAGWLPVWKHQRAGGSANGDCLDDVERYPEIDLSNADKRARLLLGRFEAAGVHPRVKDITSDIGVPTIIATAVDEMGPGLPMAHGGVGTHPDARVALMRALSELAQSRVVDIQGVREDISEPDEVVPVCMQHTKRLKTVDQRSWYHSAASARRRFEEIPSAVYSDILDDIHFMMRRLRDRGLAQIIVVDLTHPDLEIPVVRVIVPGLESWVVDHGRIGRRVTAFWCANE